MSGAPTAPALEVDDISRLIGGASVPAPGLTGLVLRRLAVSDNELLLAYRKKVFAEIANPEISRPSPNEQQHVAFALNSVHLSIGLFREARLIAYTTLFMPKTEQNLRDLHIAQFARGRAEPHHIGHVGGIMVEYAYRGMGLQRYLVIVRLAIAEKLERMHHFAFLAPANFYSWRNTLATGARMIGFCDFDDSRSGSRTCFVTYRSPERTLLQGEEYWIDSENIAVQRTFLAEGMVGTSFRLFEGRAQIAYQREGMRSFNDERMLERAIEPSI